MIRIFLAILLLFGIIMVGLFYLSPEWGRFQTLRGETAALQETAAELDTLIQSRDALLSTINAISKDDIERVNQAFPQGAHAADFLVTLESISKKNGVSLKRIDLINPTAEAKPSSGQPQPGVIAVVARPSTSIQEFPFSINISGSYESIKGFLSDLEKSLRIINVQEVTFGSTSRGEALDVTIKAKVYYQ